MLVDGLGVLCLLVPLWKWLLNPASSCCSNGGHPLQHERRWKCIVCSWICTAASVQGMEMALVMGESNPAEHQDPQALWDYRQLSCSSSFGYLREKAADSGYLFLSCPVHSFWQEVQICCNRPWPVQEGVDRWWHRAIARLENSLTR